MLAAQPFLHRLNEEYDARGSTIPLLLLRLPEFAEIAWRDGKRAAQRIEKATIRAFASAAGRVIRDGDLLAHESGSDWFAVAMVSPGRKGMPFGTIDARAALERIAATMALETGRRMESGWWPIESKAEIEAFTVTCERALERGARERDRFEFLATVGHELRTPLTSIRGYIETLLDDDIDPQTSRRFLETARREALRLARLVDGMLEFSLLDLNAVLGHGATDVSALVEAAVETLLPIARESNVTLRANVYSEARAAIDADACMHALLNVIENGVKYCGGGGTVEIRVNREGPFVCVTIDDNGRGVAPSDRERIFGYRDRGADTQSVRGKGVGLAIVRTIVERAGGTVTVGDAASGGARFAISLPAAEAEIQPAMS